jgi:cytochrome c
MKPPMRDHEETHTPRPRWLAWVIVIGMILVVFGLMTIGWRLTQL